MDKTDFTMSDLTCVGDLPENCNDLDFSEANLSGLDLSGANFRESDFSGGNLWGPS